ncbi:MAG: hypothetical protein J1E36_03095 [Eubacterium sp.]|nr:hypothetical protein [Eubacterium sp.]
MKKFLSVILAVLMAVSAFAVSVVPAMADTVVSPTASTAAKKDPSLHVNGSPASKGDISFTTKTERPFSYTFSYDGPGDLEGWENNLEDLGLVEGVDYTAVENEDGTYTITFLTEKAEKYFRNDQVIVNAVVSFPDGSTTTVANKNDSSKSPATGMSSSVVAGSVAVACAGVAVLAATKKKLAK